MLLPRELDPVAAGSDVPLPTERPSPFALSFGTMADPTEPDSDELPLPEPKPATKPGGGNGSSNGRSSKSTANSAAGPASRQRR
jgi:hypothetical protein